MKPSEIVIGHKYVATDHETGERIILTAREVRGQIVEGDSDDGREWNCPAIALEGTHKVIVKRERISCEIGGILVNEVFRAYTPEGEPYFLGEITREDLEARVRYALSPAEVEFVDG